MPNIIIGAMLFIASISMFSFSTLAGAVDRTFKGLDEVVLREGIDTISQDRPFFDKTLTTTYLLEYFSTNLKPYEHQIKYSLDITFELEFKVGDVYYPTQIDLWFQASFSGYKYTDEIIYRIAEGELYYD